MSQYGYEVVNALVTDLQPDAQVLNAMNAIESQRRLRALRSQPVPHNNSEIII